MVSTIAFVYRGPPQLPFCIKTFHDCIRMPRVPKITVVYKEPSTIGFAYQGLYSFKPGMAATGDGENVSDTDSPRRSHWTVHVPVMWLVLLITISFPLSPPQPSAFISSVRFPRITFRSLRNWHVGIKNIIPALGLISKPYVSMAVQASQITIDHPI